MGPIGFSTGALALANVRGALEMLSHTDLAAVELSALRQNELRPLIESLEMLDLSQFDYISFHAPSAIDPEFEPEAVILLREVARREWPVIVHPDAMHNLERWTEFGPLLLVENMDKRKPIGQRAPDLQLFFERLPDARMCFDIGHARQVDPTMSEAAAILERFGPRIAELHVSEVNSQSKHDPLSLASKIAFQQVAHLLPEDVPVILESRVTEDHVLAEVENAINALRPAVRIALAGD
ncbi:MAG TPA: hypothetical protein VNX88_24925 [Terriglobales bacterium]|jgi:hypothetical protein|nr:hypothetical protein [Terriglobales bacterium]